MARVDCHCLGVFTQNLNALLTSILLFLRKIDTGPLIFFFIKSDFAPSAKYANCAN